MRKATLYLTQCLMNAKQIDDLWDFICDQDFKDVQIDEGVAMSVCEVPDKVKHLIIEEVREQTGKNLEPIVIYTRFNDEDVDTSFRVHSDGSIMGQKVDWASVLYLTTGPTGTALLTHPEHGDESEGSIFTEDDGKWEVVKIFPEVENTMAIYPANKHHSRWPAKAKEFRFVIVGFFKEV